MRILSSRIVAAVSFFLVGTLFSMPSSAQTTYNWTGTSAESQWPVATDWDQGVTPGSAINGGGGSVVNDIVIITSTLAGNTQIRLDGNIGNLPAGGDAGTIGSLQVGGGSFDGNTQLQIRDGADLTVSGNVTIGGVDGATQRAGIINLPGNNTASTFTVGGNIVSGSTAGANALTINALNSTVTLSGDIDSASARTAIGGVAVNEIDVEMNEGTNGFVFAGSIAQELNVDAFRVMNTGGNNGVGTQTIGFNAGSAKVTVNANSLRVGSTNNNNRTGNAGILIVDGGEINSSGDAVIGRTNQQASGGNDTGVGNGTLTVGTTANAGTVNIGGDLILAQQLGTTAGNAQVAIGTVNVDNAGSVLTVNGVLNMGATLSDGTATGGTTTATFNVNEGLAVLNGDIVDGMNGTFSVNTSTINVNGGRLNLANVSATKAVDTLNFGDGTGTDTIEFALTSYTAALATTTTVVGAGATIDVTTLSADPMIDDATVDSWIGGAGTWDTTGSNWDLSVTPDSYGGFAMGQEIDLITGTLSGGTAMLDAGDMGGWTIFQDATKISVTARAAVGPSTVIAANIAGTGSVVTRTTDLNIQNAIGQGSDATSLTLSDGASLSLTGTGTDLILGGAGDTGNVTQGVLGETNATAVSVAGDLVYGNGGAGTSGGTYNLNSGTLSVTGDIVEGASGAPDAAVDTAVLNLNSSVVNALSVGGSINVQGLNVGNEDLSNATQTFTGKTVNVSGNLTVGGGIAGALDGVPGTVVGATGMLTLDGGTATAGTGVNVGEDGDSQGTLNLINNASLISSARVYIAGDQTGDQDSETKGTLNINSGGSLTVQSGNTEIGRDGAGFFTVDGGSYTQEQGNLVLGQGGGAANVSRGTVIFTNNAIVTVGIDNPGDPETLLSSINFNAGGGDIVQSFGAMVSIEQSLNMNDATAESSYMTSGGTLFIGLNLNAGSNQLIIVGDDATITVVGDLNLNSDSNLTFDFQSLALITDINIGGNANLGDANLLLSNVSALATYTNDVVLLDTSAGGVTNGTFAGLSEGAAISGTDYLITYNYLGNGSTALIAVPEPASLAVVGLACVGLAARRRRRSQAALAD